MDFTTAYASYRKYIGMPGQPASRRRGPGRPAKRSKIVVAGDFHCPWQHREAIAQMVREEAADTDILVVNGDLSDWWTASRWPKRKREVDVQTELSETQATLCLMSKHFREIRIVRGNHDSRPRKLIAEQLPIEMVEYLDIVAPSAMDPLQFLVHGLENVHIVEAPRSGHAEFGFLHQIGDAVFTHAETYSIIPGRAAGNVCQWIKSFAEPKGIVSGQVRCTVQGHVHQGATQVGNFGVLQIEGGCLCQDEEYIGSPKIQTPRPWCLGWTVIHQDRGVTDFRTSRFIPFIPS